MPIISKKSNLLRNVAVAATIAGLVSLSLGLQVTDAEAGSSSKRAGVSSFASAGGLGTTRIRTSRGRRN